MPAETDLCCLADSWNACCVQAVSLVRCGRLVAATVLFSQHAGERSSTMACTPARRHSHRSAAIRPLESLESRVLLSTYYVSSAGGSDAAAGGGDAPWATLQRAANAVRPGDTVVVR